VTFGLNGIWRFLALRPESWKALKSTLVAQWLAALWWVRYQAVVVVVVVVVVGGVRVGSVAEVFGG
jgi:hypothetical protein